MTKVVIADGREEEEYYFDKLKMKIITGESQFDYIIIEYDDELNELQIRGGGRLAITPRASNVVGIKGDEPFRKV